MSEATIDRILAAAERVQLLGKTRRSQRAVVVAQALNMPLADVLAVLDAETKP